MFHKLFFGLSFVLNLLTLTEAQANGSATVPNGYDAAFIRQTALYSDAFNKLLNEQPQLRNRLRNISVASDLRRQFNVNSRTVEFDFSDAATKCIVTYNVYFKDENTVDSVRLNGCYESCSTILDMEKLFKR